MPDGTILLADHYWPVIDRAAPTVLVRCPYGRGFPYDFMYGGMLAQQGFHVIIQSCRGTAGSGGEFEPFVNEAADGLATVAWLRQQDWFSGSLGTIGASYLGFTQWALAADPPPELKAMVVQVSSDDFYGFLYPGGAFAMAASLTGVAAMVAQQHGFAAFAKAIVRLFRHHRRVARTLPFLDAYPAAIGERVPWFERWLSHPGADDPFWDSRRAEPRLPAAPPVSLLGGWADVCTDPTLDAYRRLRAAGRTVRLVVGPWNHTSGFDKDMPVTFGEALRWLRAHLDAGPDVDGQQDVAGAPDVTHEDPVRVWFGAAGSGVAARAGNGVAARAGKGPAGAEAGWRDLADWPPPGTEARPWRLTADRTLLSPGTAGAAPLADGSAADNGRDNSQADSAPANDDPADGSAAALAAPAVDAVTAFRYDPRDPTPSVGGVSMDSNDSGARRNDALEARPDVVTFTSPPLTDLLEVAGPVSVRLRVRGSSPYFDVFARLCDVDAAGHSWNVCDGLLRIGTGAGAGGSAGAGGWAEIEVPMSSTAHRFAAGHRVRLQVSGGAHPRFARNTGTGEPVATATEDGLIAVDIEIAHDPARPCALTLPVMTE
jgi:hypothetical protein